MNAGQKFLRETARNFAEPEELAEHGLIFTEKIVQRVMSKDHSHFFY